ncbi:MAG: Gldg family protein [Clostridia bacterium]|nr:Gldg family protein [Clostridia bacterium]
MGNFKQKLTSVLRGRNFASGLLVALLIAAVVFINIICYTLSDYFKLYFYVPEQVDFSISDTFREKFTDASGRLGKKVTVTFCMDETDVKNHSTGEYVYNTAKKFEEKYPELISLRFINIYRMSDADGNDVSEELEIYKKDVKGNPTLIKPHSVIFSTDTSYRVVTDGVTKIGFSDFYTLDSSLSVTSYNGEEVFASMVSWVLTEKHGTAYFTVGHGETASASLYNVLTAAGYYVDTLNLRDSKVLAVPEDAELVVVSNPVNDFEEGSSVKSELDKLRHYRDNGGSVFVTLDSYATRLYALYEFIGEYGISLKTTENGEMQTVKDVDNGITTDGYTIVAEYSDTYIGNKVKDKLSDLGGRVILRDVSPLNVTGAAKSLLETSSSSVCHSGGQVSDSSGSYTIAAYSELTGETGKTARLFFIPSIYLTATDAMVTNGYANKDFLFSVFDVFYGMGDMPYGCNSIVYDSLLLENLTMGTAKLYTAALLVIPAAVAVVGAVVLIRRKNR